MWRKNGLHQILMCGAYLRRLYMRFYGWITIDDMVILISMPKEFDIWWMEQDFICSLKFSWFPKISLIYFMQVLMIFVIGQTMSSHTFQFMWLSEILRFGFRTLFKLNTVHLECSTKLGCWYLMVSFYHLW